MFNSLFIASATTLLLTGLSPSGAKAFEINSTTKEQLCLETMNAREQELRFSRMVNIGASYSKGCFTCDFDPKTRKHLKEIGEYGWVNRHYLIKFLQQTSWKNPEGFEASSFTIVENDPRHSGSNMLDQISKDSPYLNLWKLDSMDGELEIVRSSNEIEELLSYDHFKQDSSAVGGIRVETDPQKRHEDHNYGGHLYQTTPGIWNGNGGAPKSIFDFAVDGTRSSEIFSFLGDEKLFKELMDSGWKDEIKRNQLMKIVGEKIAKTHPSIVVSGDALFWDSVPRFLARINSLKKASIVTKLLTSKIVREKLLGKVVYPMEQEERMISDFLRLLSDLSIGRYGNKPVPVVVARLIHNVGYEFENEVFAKDFALFVGAVIENIFGVDVSKYAVKALTGFKRSDYASMFDGDDAEVAKGFAPGPESLGFKDWALKQVLKQLVKDLPLVVMALEKSFNETNEILKKFVAEENVNFKVIEVDDFYRSIPYGVSTKTIHPSSFGSEIMAKVFREKLCE